MINRFLQFIKKQQFALKLAQEDLLFLTDGITAFDSVRPVASMFVRKSRLSKFGRIKKFLREEDNPLLSAITGEVFSLTDSQPDYLPFQKRTFSGEVLLRTAKNIKDSSFYLNLFSEVIKKDFPFLNNGFADFYNSLNMYTDMRLYGSELETLAGFSVEYETCCRMEIDWIKTSKENLYVHFDQKCRQVKKLPPEAQKNLSRLFAELLCEKSVFVSLWNGVLLSPNNEVGFLDFDRIYTADNFLKDYAFAFIKERKEPQRPEEWKLRRALLLLERYCPDIDCFSVWKDIRVARSSTEEKRTDTKILQYMRENGFDFGTTDKYEMTNPQDVAYLLNKQSRKKDSAYRKSGFLYWGPLLLAMFLLLKYF